MSNKSQRIKNVTPGISTILVSIAFLVTLSFVGYGQHGKPIRELSLFDVIEIAQDSSLQSLISESSVFAAYWRYKNYRAQRLPSIGLSASPFTFNRRITQQFDNSDNSFRYFETQNLNSDVELSIDQNLLLTGGKLSVNSDVGRLVNFGDVNSTQFSATQVRIGLNQPLFAHNPFKWDKMTEPLAYEKAKKDFVKSAETVAIRAVELYFSLVEAQMSRNIAETNMHNADTLYHIGKKRGTLTTITKPDLLNLKLEYLNSQSEFVKSKNALNKAKANLRTFLNIEEEIEGRFGVEDSISNMFVPVDEAIENAQRYNPDYLDFKQRLINANRNVDREKKTSRLQANLSASAGLNQQGETFGEAYRDPLDQQRFNLILTIPIVDWGLARGRYRVASREREVTRLSIRQEEVQMEQEIINTVLDFNLKKQILVNAKEASKVAIEVYELNKSRFLQGIIDVNTLIIYQQRKDNAQRKYIGELQSYWYSYFYIRSITLYDFKNNRSLVAEMEGRLTRLLN